MFGFIFLLGLIWVACQIISAIMDSQAETEKNKKLKELEVKKKEEEYKEEKRKKELEEKIKNRKSNFEDLFLNDFKISRVESYSLTDEYSPTIYIDLEKKNCILTLDFLSSYSFSFNDITPVRIDSFTFNPSKHSVDEYGEEFFNFLYVVFNNSYSLGCTFEQFKDKLKTINQTLRMKCLVISFKDITKEDIKVYFIESDKTEIQLNKFKHLLDRIVEIGKDYEISDL